MMTLAQIISGLSIASFVGASFFLGGAAVHSQSAELAQPQKKNSVQAVAEFLSNAANCRLFLGEGATGEDGLPADYSKALSDVFLASKQDEIDTMGMIKKACHKE